MSVRNNHSGPVLWRRLIICLSMTALLLGGIRLHALQFTATAYAAVSSDHHSLVKRQSFDTDDSYCVPPPRIFAFEPASAVFSRVVAAHDVFLPAHPDG